MILLIDNYDSFSYNLFQLIGVLDADIRVMRNDELSVDEIAALKPQVIVLSPGPGRPENAGVCEEVVRQLGGHIPMLGVCLGHQAIVQAYGGRVSYARELMHGKTSACSVDTSSPLFASLEHVVQVGRYHSLSACEESIPSCLHVIAKSDDGEIMAVQHEKDPVFGVQFHPESIMTPQGMTMLANFLAYARAFSCEQ